MTNLPFSIAPVTRNDFGQILNKSVILSLKRMQRGEQRRSRRKCSFPGVRTTKIKKENWSARSESVLHENNNTAATENKGTGFVWQGLVLNFAKYSHVQTQTNVFRKVLVELVSCYQRTL